MVVILQIFFLYEILTPLELTCVALCTNGTKEYLTPITHTFNQLDIFRQFNHFTLLNKSWEPKVYDNKLTQCTLCTDVFKAADRLGKSSFTQAVS